MDYGLSFKQTFKRTHATRSDRTWRSVDFKMLKIWSMVFFFSLPKKKKKGRGLRANGIETKTTTRGKFRGSSSSSRRRRQEEEEGHGGSTPCTERYKNKCHILYLLIRKTNFEGISRPPRTLTRKQHENDLSQPGRHFKLYPHHRTRRRHVQGRRFPLHLLGQSKLPPRSAKGQVHAKDLPS